MINRRRVLSALVATATLRRRAKAATPTKPYALTRAPRVALPLLDHRALRKALGAEASRISTNPYQRLRRQVFMLNYPISAKIGETKKVARGTAELGLDEGRTYQRKCRFGVVFGRHSPPKPSNGSLVGGISK